MPLPALIVIAYIGVAALTAAALRPPSAPNFQGAHPPPDYTLTAEDDAFLEDLSRRSFRFFWDEADPQTGIVRDRARTDGTQVERKTPDVGSIASVGFGLSGLCIAAERNWVPREAALERARNTLRYFAERSPHERGWFYHFVNIRTGEREWRSELSSIDTALLVAGVLTARRCFDDDPDIVRFADAIYVRIDFPWMLNGHPHLLSMGWRPESGFIEARWKHYCELMILYLLAIGSPTHPIPAAAWQAWRRPTMGYGEFEYLSWQDPLFVHQYSQAWVDFRGRREQQAPHIDWWRNSIEATYAHKAFCLSLAGDFPGYSEHVWGFTASDSAKGYVAWHGPPRHERIDGSVVPAAAGGSLMLAPEIALPALREMRRQYGDRIYEKYGFADAFNPTSGWVNPDVIGIDVGITLLSAENLRTGRIWRWFMANPEIGAAMDRVGLERSEGERGELTSPGRPKDLRRTAPTGSPGVLHYEFVVPGPAAERSADRDTIEKTAALPDGGFERRSFTSPDGFVVPYRLLQPARASGTSRVPLVVVFEGSGGSGAERAAFAKFWQRDDVQRDFPAYVLVPGFPAPPIVYSGPATQGARTSMAAAPLHAALALVDDMSRTLPVDPERVYLTGFSDGASAVWNALHLRPAVFAAAVAIAGVANRAFAPFVASTPIWVHHGNADEVNAIAHERMMFDALSRCSGAAIVFWEHDRLGHELPPSILSGSHLPQWLFRHRRAAEWSGPRSCF